MGSVDQRDRERIRTGKRQKRLSPNFYPESGYGIQGNRVGLILLGIGRGFRFSHVSKLEDQHIDGAGNRRSYCDSRFLSDRSL